MKKTLLIVLTILIIGLAPVLSYAVVNNSVINGDFDNLEEVSRDWETFIYDGDDTGATLDFVSEDGNVFVQLGSEQPDYVSIRQAIFLKADTTYEIGAKIKAENISDNGLGAYIRLEENQGQSKQIRGSTEVWQDVTFYVSTLSTDIYTTLEIGVGDAFAKSSGILYVDDVYIVERAIVPHDEDLTLINPDSAQAAVQQQPPTQNTVVTAFFSDSEKLSILFLLLMTAVFMILLTWYSSKKRPLILEGKFSPSMSALFICGAFTLIVFYKYVVASFGTDLPSDIGYFTSWSQSMVDNGLKYFYQNTNANYPAGYMYILYFVGLVAKLFGVSFHSPAFNLMLKTPVIAAEILTALLAYRTAKRHLGEKNAIIFSIILLLNPAVLLNTSAWGQVDAIFTLSVVLIFYLLQRKHVLWTAAAFGLAMLIKTQSILFLPVIGAYYLTLFLRDRDVKENLRDFLLSLVISVAVFIVLSLPFMGDDGVCWAFKQIFSSAYTYDYTSMNAFNFFTLFGGNYARFSDSFMLLTYQAWGYIFIVIASLISVFLTFINRKKQRLFLIAAFIIGAVFTFGHGMHERYIMPLPILLMFAYIDIRDRRILNGAILYTIFALFSQAAVLFFFGADFYNAIVITMSLFGLGCFGYLVYLVYTFLIKSGAVMTVAEKARPEEIKRRNKQKTKQILGKVNKKPAMNLLKRESKARLDKIDRIMMIAMTVIYAMIAFINLGSFKIPETMWQPSYTNQQLIVEFEDEATVDQIKYYFGLGETDVTVTGSQDGAFFYDVAMPGGEADSLIISHKQGQMFRWHFIDTSFNCKYVGLTFSDTDIEAREISFIDPDGAIIPVKRVFIPERDIEIPVLTDESDLTPDVISYKDGMYFDEIYHARTAYEQINHLSPYEITHPPLGKTLLSIGIRIFGMTPFGWRFMGTLFGVLMLPIMYLFAKRLTKRTTFAVIATFLLMFDFMHFAQTRIGTIDSYAIFFILLMFMFMYDYFKMNYNTDKLYKTFIPLGLTGLAFGFGAATKWLCLYAGLGLAVIFFFTMIQRFREFKAAKMMLNEADDKHKALYQRVVNTYYYKTVMTLLFCFIVFIAIPMLIYYLSYIPYMRVEGNPYDFKMILNNQPYMYNYHSTLDTTASPHPFASRWPTWLLNLRPIYFFQGQGYPDNIISSLSSFGNPFIWWALFPAVVMILFAKYYEFNYNGALGFVTVAGLSELLPWVFIARETYIYHYFATVLFMILIITMACKYIWDKTKYGKFIILFYMLIVLGAFIAFYPVITGVPASRAYVEGLRWVESWPFY